MLLDEFFNLPQVFEKTEPIEFLAIVRATDAYPEFSARAETPQEAKFRVLQQALKHGIKTPVILVKKIVSNNK